MTGGLVDLRGIGIPPWMDPDENPPIPCHLEHECSAVHYPAQTTEPSLIVQPISRTTGVDWPAIREHATRLGLPQHQPVSPASARRRPEAHHKMRGTRPAPPPP